MKQHKFKIGDELFVYGIWSTSNLLPDRGKVIDFIRDEGLKVKINNNFERVIHCKQCILIKNLRNLDHHDFKVGDNVVVYGAWFAPGLETSYGKIKKIVNKEGLSIKFDKNFEHVIHHMQCRKLEKHG